MISLSFLGTNSLYLWTPAVTSSSQIMRYFSICIIVFIQTLLSTKSSVHKRQNMPAGIRGKRALIHCWEWELLWSLWNLKVEEGGKL